MADVIFTFYTNVTFTFSILFVVSFKFIEVTLLDIFCYFHFFDIFYVFILKKTIILFSFLVFILSSKIFVLGCEC